MRHILELSLGTVVALAFAAGCGGSSTNTAASGGTSSSAGASSTSGGASSSSGGASSTSGGASSAKGGATSSSGGTTATGAPFMTTLPASTSLGSLTAAQGAQICQDLANYVDKGAFSTELANGTCGTLDVLAAAGSATDAAAQAACTAAAAECISSISAPTLDAGTQDCTPPDSTCTATVGDLETCLNDLSSALAKAGSTAPSCATLTVAKVNATLAQLEIDAGAAGGLTDPPSCVSFDAKCPGMNVTPPGM